MLRLMVRLLLGTAISMISCRRLGARSQSTHTSCSHCLLQNLISSSGVASWAGWSATRAHGEQSSENNSSGRRPVHPNTDGQLVKLEVKLLRPGCLGMAQFLANTPTESELGETPEELASKASSSPLIFPLRVDDCMALVLYKRVCICIRKHDRARAPRSMSMAIRRD